MSAIHFDSVHSLAGALMLAASMTDSAKAMRVAEKMIKYANTPGGAAAPPTSQPPAPPDGFIKPKGDTETTVQTSDLSIEGLAAKIAQERKIDFASAQVIAFDLAYPRGAAAR